LLTLGAVIGREFDVAVLSPLAGLDPSAVVEALADARLAALVREVKGAPGRFTFVHALIRHTIYDDLGPARRVELHRRVAEALESLEAGDAYLTDLAHHWVAASPAIGIQADAVAKAARYAEQAGRRAMASLAYEEAAHHFEDALGAARQGDDAAQISELLIVLGEAQRCAGDPAHRETLLEAGRLAHEHGDADRAARAALANQRGVSSRLGAVDGERVAALERALEAVGPAVTPVRARLLARLATELHFAGDERRLELAREALSVARQLEDQETLAQALAALWFAAWGSADEGERASIAGELNGVAGQLGDRTLQFHAGAALFLAASGVGDMEVVDQALSGCVRIAEELGQPVLRWRAAYLQTHQAMATGRFDEAERWGEEALRLGEVAGQPDHSVHSSLHELRLLQGRFEEAEELIRPAVDEFPGTEALPALLAWALAGQGRTEEAKAILDRFRSRAFADTPRDYTRLLFLASLSRVCSRLGDSAAAATLYNFLLPSRAAMTTGQTSWLGPVTHDLGLLATVLERYDEAEDHFAAAADVQDRIGARGTVVHTRLEWARMLLRRGRSEDVPRARTLLEEARAGAREASIPAIEARIEQLLAQIQA
jgi:tetratricopeptide (TPR) repeat protein